MAPSITETVSLRTAPTKPLRTEGGHNKENFAGLKSTYNHDDEIKGTAKQPPASFPNYLPVWDNETEKYVHFVSSNRSLRRIDCASRYPPLTPFEHYDHGKDADPNFPDLLPEGKYELDHLTPTIGTEIKGVQLSQLSKEGKDQLALFVAQRKVVGMTCHRHLQRKRY